MAKPQMYSWATETDAVTRDAADMQLFESMQADPAAFAALLKRWWRPLVQYATRIVDSGDAAEDAVQDAFVRFWERRGLWQRGTVPRVLLYTLTRNLALNQRKQVASRLQSLASRSPSFPRPVPTPVEATEEEEFRAALEAAIQRLPERRREVLMLSRVDGLSRAEIAQVTGLAEQSVANCLALALRDLRVALRPFLEADPHGFAAPASAAAEERVMRAL